MENFVVELSCIAALIETLLHRSDEDSDSNKTEDAILFVFYEQLIKRLLSYFYVSRNEVTDSTKFLIHAYRNTNNGRIPYELDFNDLSLCLAYLHRYAMCHAAMVQKAMTNVFDSTFVAIDEKLKLKKLNVVFLGSGPGNDFVGFLSALYGHHDRLFELNVTAVDRYDGWSEVFDETIRHLRKGSFGSGSFGPGRIFEDVNVITNYIKADMTDFSGRRGKMRTAMEKADFVFLVKVLSHIPEEYQFNTLQNVVLSLKPGALLVFIDCPLPTRLFKKLRVYLDVVYEAFKERFPFDFEVKRFGYPNITSSQAYVSIYEKVHSE